MTTSKKASLVFLLLLALAACGTGYSFYTKLRKAKAASQCAVLSRTIANDAQKMDDDGDSFALGPYLQTLDGGPLFPRDETGRLTDPWGTPLVIEAENHERAVTIRVIGVGPDRKLGTKDDCKGEASYERRWAAR